MSKMSFPVPFLHRSLISHTRRASIFSQDWFVPSPKPEVTAALKWQWQHISHIQRNVQKTAERDESMLINTQDHLKSERRQEALSREYWGHQAGGRVPLSGAGSDKYTEINDSLRKRSATLDLSEPICCERASRDMQQWPLSDDSFWGHHESPFLESIALRAFSHRHLTLRRMDFSRNRKKGGTGRGLCIDRQTWSANGKF